MKKIVTFQKNNSRLHQENRDNRITMPEEIIEICPECKKQNPESAKFCGFCGMPMVEAIDSDLILLKSELEPKNYQIKRKIGQGGMGSVYLVEQTKLERDVVVKILNADFSQNKEFRERFLREARTEAKLKHFAIVEIIDVGVVEGRPYFIMEYGESGSLLGLLEKSKSGLQLKDAIFYTTRILLGLELAHSKGVIHRDIKPENILIRENGDPFIVDFGIAKTLSNTMKTESGQLLGTVDYMSPEQCSGSIDIDNRSDIYSIGIMLYQLLTGKLPFIGSNSITVINKHISEPFPILSEDSINLPTTMDKETTIQAMNAIIQKACQKDKAARYESASEMIHALSKIGNGNNVPITSQKRYKKNKKIFVLVVSVLLLLIAGFIFTKYKKTNRNISKEPELIITEGSLWTNHLGKMNWEKAKKKCESYKLRLPDIDELNEAYNSNITTSWINEGKNFWSISVKNDQNAFYMNVYYGFKYDSDKNNNYSVRCYTKR